MVDCLAMHVAVAFEEVLDATLNGLPIEPPAVGESGRTGTAASYGFFFVEAHAAVSSAVAGVTPGCGVRYTPCPVSPERTDVEVCAGVPGECRSDTSWASLAQPQLAGLGAPQTAAQRPARRLSAPQRVALADLVALGASLDERFTNAQLRSAFRSLARRYHPDRHLGCTAAEKAELSLMFGRLRDAYRALAAVAN